MEILFRRYIKMITIEIINNILIMNIIICIGVIIIKLIDKLMEKKR